VDPLVRNLEEVACWISSAPSPKTLERESDFMRLLVNQVMGRALCLLRMGVALAPPERVNSGYIRRHAVVVGHMVRLTKLFDGFYLHVAKRQLELAGVMIRLIHETEIRLNYLLAKATPHSYKSFILASYRADRESLADLEAKARARKLLPIETRMRRSIRKHLKRDGITRRQLMANRVWDIDGKNVRALLKDLGREEFYSYSFAGSSRWVHGTWQELRLYHLQVHGARFMPRLDFGDPDTRIAAPTTIICLDTLMAYLRWSRGDTTGTVTSIVSDLRDYVIEVDRAHERRLAANAV
jgi:hypothetical protein